MKILLINPAPSGTLQAVGVLFPPLGLLYIAANMERKGYQLKGRIFRRRRSWSFFDMQHLVFKHDHLSFIRLEWLLLKASLLYYTRSKKAIQDIRYHIKKHRLGLRTLLRFLKDYFGG